MKSTAPLLIVGLVAVALGIAMIAFRKTIARFNVAVGRTSAETTQNNALSFAVFGLVFIGVGVFLLVRAAS